MATAAKSSKGVKLKMGDGGSPTEVFTALAEVKDIGGPDEAAEQLDATSLDSTAKEYVAGLSDAGTVKCEMNALQGDTQQGALYTAFQAGTKKNFQIVLPEGGGWQFAAIVKDHSRKFGTNAIRTISFSLQVSGSISAMP